MPMSAYELHEIETHIANGVATGIRDGMQPRDPVAAAVDKVRERIERIATPLYVQSFAYVGARSVLDGSDAQTFARMAIAKARVLVAYVDEISVHEISEHVSRNTPVATPAPSDVAATPADLAALVGRKLLSELGVESSMWRSLAYNLESAGFKRFGAAVRDVADELSKTPFHG